MVYKVPTNDNALRGNQEGRMPFGYSLFPVLHSSFFSLCSLRSVVRSVLVNGYTTWRREDPTDILNAALYQFRPGGGEFGELRLVE